MSEKWITIIKALNYPVRAPNGEIENVSVTHYKTPEGIFYKLVVPSNDPRVRWYTLKGKIEENDVPKMLILLKP